MSMLLVIEPPDRLVDGYMPTGGIWLLVGFAILIVIMVIWQSVWWLLKTVVTWILRRLASVGQTPPDDEEAP